MNEVNTGKVEGDYNRGFRLLRPVWLVFGAVFVGAVIIGIQHLAGEQAGLLLVGIFVAFLIVPFMLYSSSQSRYYGMLLFLPFTQVLSVKLGARWSISELLALSLIPVIAGEAFTWRGAKQKILGLSLLLLLYSVFVSIVSLLVILPMFPWQESAIFYFYSPVLRTVVENLRLLASITCFLLPLHFARDERSFVKGLRFFAVSGIMASLYGLYQGIQVLWLPSLPLLPGTLSQDGAFLRLWGSFYEPTGLGGFLLASSIVIAFLVLHDQKNSRWWLIGLTVALAGLLLSVSTVAWFAGLVALGSLFIFGLFLVRRGPTIGGGLILIGMLVVTLMLLATILDLNSIFQRNLFWGYIRYRVQESGNVEATWRWLSTVPVGVGQGLFEFLQGGAPGAIRWIAELGVPGLSLTLALHSQILIAIRRMLRQDGSNGAFAPFGLALYLAMLIVASRYAYITHVWLWFAMGIPIVAFNFPETNTRGAALGI